MYVPASVSECHTFHFLANKITISIFEHHCAISNLCLKVFHLFFILLYINYTVPST